MAAEGVSRSPFRTDCWRDRGKLAPRETPIVKATAQNRRLSVEFFGYSGLENGDTY
jgi:hypothetical protein